MKKDEEEVVEWVMAKLRRDELNAGLSKRECSDDVSLRNKALRLMKKADELEAKMDAAQKGKGVKDE